MMHAGRTIGHAGKLSLPVATVRRMADLLKGRGFAEEKSGGTCYPGSPGFSSMTHDRTKITLRKTEQRHGAVFVSSFGYETPFELPEKEFLRILVQKLFIEPFSGKDHGMGEVREYANTYVSVMKVSDDLDYMLEGMNKVTETLTAFLTQEDVTPLVLVAWESAPRLLAIIRSFIAAGLKPVDSELFRKTIGLLESYHNAERPLRNFVSRNSSLFAAAQDFISYRRTD